MPGQVTAKRDADSGTGTRVMLISDLGLDRPYLWATPEIAQSRRAAAKGVLVELLAEARRRSVDAIAIAGNMFNRNTVKPATMQWLVAALRSATVPVLITPGNEDFIGPLGGYSRHVWPENVVLFVEERMRPYELTNGVTIWGAANCQAHKPTSFLDGFRVDRAGVNLGLFHAAETSGHQREPELDPCAPFSESEVERSGLDHALVGHYRQPHLGRLHVYPGTPLAHEFGASPTGGGIIVTVNSDGSLGRERFAVSSPELHEVEVDVTGARSKTDVLRRFTLARSDRSGILRVRVMGDLSPGVVLRREDFLKSLPDQAIVVWEVQTDIDPTIAQEASIRGQFVRDVLGSHALPQEGRGRVLLIGLRALAGQDELDLPR
jgi:DNA repair protein SbcD/Mre11